MSILSYNHYLFSSESVGEGHPDKLDSFKLASQLSKIERLASFAINDK